MTMTEVKQITAVHFHTEHSHVQTMSSTSAPDVGKVSDTTEDEIIIQFEKGVQFLSVYYTLALLVVGIVCNLLSIAVLSRRSFRGTSMSVYLRFLSVMDLGTILTGLTHFYHVSIYGAQEHRTVLSCQLNNWFMNVFLYSSGWTLVSVTVERVFSIVKPHQVKILCSPSRIVFVLSFIVMCMGALNSPVFFIFGNLEVTNPATNETYIRSCVIVADRVAMSLMYWWMDATVSAFLPSLLLMIFNIVIVKGVINSRRNIEKVTNRTKTQALSGSNPESSEDKSGRKGKRQSGSSKKESSLTVTLLVINLTFVICNFPICAFALGPHYHTEEGMGRLGDALMGLLLMLMYTNNALNFWLYFITGSKFRSEFLALLTEIFEKLMQTCSR